MLYTISPWLYELNRKHQSHPLIGNHDADVAVIGAGIAGVTTAYYILTTTSRSVTMVEGDLVASGATGHNAGQVVDYFEKPFFQMADEFGLDAAVAAQKSVSHAWTQLEDIFEKTQIRIPFAKFEGVAGLRTGNDLKDHLHNYHLRETGGLPVKPVLVAEDAYERFAIDDVYRRLVKTVPRDELADILQTHDTSFIAALQERKGALNSARYAEEMVLYLLTAYPTRFTIYEKSPVTRISIAEPTSRITSLQGELIARDIVLCTNGFEQLSLETPSGIQLDEKFRESVYGIIGYMAAFIEDLGLPPGAVSYLTGNSEYYYYMTRRDFYYEGAEHELICIGGPQKIYTHEIVYLPDTDYPGSAEVEIRDFLRRTYRHYDDDSAFVFKWQGLMGYTRSGVRIAGAEPSTPHLYYNLGCNGVGILPSVMGARKIGRLIAGERLAADIFDPT